jgi:6-phosphogluconolactonase
VFGRDDKHLFVVNELANTVTSYAYDPAGPSLEPLDERSALPPGVSEGQAAAIRLSPHGKQLLVSNRGHDSVAAMPFDQKGILGAPSFHQTGGAWPRDLALTPDHEGLLVANERSDLITMLRHDPVAGRIGPVVAAVDVPSPSCVAFA